MELDIVAGNLRHIVFVEVKTRTYTEETIHTAPPPMVAVKSEKQAFTRRAARQYLYENPTKKSPRMDVIEIWLLKKRDDARVHVAKIHHIKAAY